MNTRAWWDPLPRLPAPSRQLSRTRRVLQRISPFFPGGVHPLYGLAHGGATDLHGGDCPQILTPLLQSEKGVLLEIRFEQLAGSLVYLGFRAGSLLGRERSALLVQLGVAFDGGEADGKGAGGLALSHPAPERFDDLFPEVF